MKKRVNILKKADEIVNRRSQEKYRQYGDFSQSMQRAAKIASEMRGKEIDVHDMFCCMIALKFSRQSFSFKEDNLLDAAAYIGGWANYITESAD
jgi:thiamine biosynthesis protein ThiC